MKLKLVHVEGDTDAYYYTKLRKSPTGGLGTSLICQCTPIILLWMTD